MARVIIITGTSSGLGLELAALLVSRGEQVYATMRNLDKAEPLRARLAELGTSAELRRLDVEDNASVNNVVQEVIAKEGRIDVLINNAGAGYARTTEQATEEEIRWQMDVNFMGVVRGTKAVLPHMRKAGDGHIINITSVGGLVGQPFNEFYCAAKFAVEGYTESLASYIQPEFGVKFTLVEPGGISTAFAPSVMKNFESTGGIHDDAYRPILERYIKNATARMSSAYQTATEVAEVVVGCIDLEEPPLRLRTSDWGEAFCKMKTGLDPSGRLLAQATFNHFLTD